MRRHSISGIPFFGYVRAWLSPVEFGSARTLLGVSLFLPFGFKDVRA
jgi:hypothetical protein